MPPKKEQNAQALRVLSRELGLEPSWRVAGKRVYMESELLSEMIHRLQHAKTVSARYACAPESRVPAPVVIHMFWDDPEALCTGDRSPRSLQSSDLLGLWSALNVGLSVHLWSYAEIGNVIRHSNLSLRSASELLSHQTAVDLLTRGLRIQHLADYVRYLAVQDHGKRFGVGSWLGDLDFVWIRRMGVCPSQSGHVFATMDAKPWTARGVAGDMLHWKTQWVRSPDEFPRHFANSPMAFPASSAVLDSSLADMVELFGSRQDLSKLNYTAIIAIALRQVRSSGLLLDVMEPMAFHPTPHFC